MSSSEYWIKQSCPLPSSRVRTLASSQLLHAFAFARLIGTGKWRCQNPCAAPSLPRAKHRHRRVRDHLPDRTLSLSICIRGVAQNGGVAPTGGASFRHCVVLRHRDLSNQQHHARCLDGRTVQGLGYGSIELETVGAAPSRIRHRSDDGGKSRIEPRSFPSAAGTS
jgi:hypothetical protein